MNEIEIRSLNGYKLVDETARQAIEDIKKNGVGSDSKLATEEYVQQYVESAILGGAW